MSAVWRCRICEGVNQGGRICATCGAQVPHGEPLRAAVRTRLPSALEPAPPPVPPTPRRRDLRQLPSPAEMSHIDPDDLFDTSKSFHVSPLPGGCLVSIAPRRLQQRTSEWE
jgi:hypothetical protein